MSEDQLAKRGRSLEEEYFRRRDRELIEKMQQAAAADRARGEMGRQTGLSDPALLQELEELGFTPETVSLLPLVPMIEMAWAEGGVTSAERDLLVKVARARGITQGSAADGQLARWMAERPDTSVFERARRLIAAMLASGSGSPAAGVSADDLVAQCEQIAAASGGIFGIGRVSAEERSLLAEIARDLKSRHG